MNKFYLFLMALFASIGIGHAATPSSLYVIGDGCGWNSGNAAQLTKNGDVFTGSFTLTGNESRYFRFQTEANGGTTYGAASSNVNVNLDGTSRYLVTGNANNWYQNSGTIYVKVDFSGSSPYAYFDTKAFSVGSSSTVPSELYIYGNAINGKDSWNDASNAFKMTKNDNIFTADVTFNLDGGYSYFRLTKSTSQHNDSSNKWGAQTNDLSVSTNGTEVQCYAGYDNAWKIANGEYAVKVDFSSANPMLSVTPKQTVNPPALTVPTAFYLIGNGYGYDNSGSPQAMTKSGSKFTLENISFSANKDGGYSYVRFATASNLNDGKYGAGSENVVPTLGTPASLTKDNGHNFKIKDDAYDITVDFTNAAAPTVTFAKHETVVTPPTPVTGQVYFYHGTAWNQNIVMTKEGSAFKYEFTPAAGGMYYFAFSQKNLEISGNQELFNKFGGDMFGGANGNNDMNISVNTPLTATKGYKRPFAFNATKGYVYTITVTDVTETTMKVTLTSVKTGSDDPISDIADPENTEGGKYLYFCGDMNVWSFIGRNSDSGLCRYYEGWKQGGGEQGEFVEEEGSSFVYKTDNPDMKYYKFATLRDLNTKWRFEKCATPSEQTGDNWWKLDLKANGAKAPDGVVGRLSGQFIITDYNWDSSDRYAVDGHAHDNHFDSDAYAKEYYTGQIKVGTLYTKGRQGNGQNFCLANGYVDDAVIYLNKDNGNILITGTPGDNYAYYAVVGEEQFSAPASTILRERAQVNYFTPADYFQNGTKINDDANYDFKWELVENVPYTTPAGKTYTFPKVWRKKIPTGAVNRYPMSYAVGITTDAGRVFDPVLIRNNDAWFIENNVHLHFRFEDESRNEIPGMKVYYNAWVDRYDENNALLDKPYYLSEKFIAMSDEMVEVTDEAHNDRKWFKSEASVPGPFDSAGYAMFATTYGGFYPSGGFHASLSDKHEMAIGGLDFFFEVPKSDPRVGILYSHLNGTFKMGRDATSGKNLVQINAEFFVDNEGAFNHGHLDTTYADGSLQYRFRIYDKTGELVDVDGSDYNTWINEPFFNWEITEAGLYNVNVQVREADGTIHSAQDVYAVFPEN